MDNAERIAMMTEQAAMTPNAPVAMEALPCGFLHPNGDLSQEVTVRSITGEEEDILASDKVPPYMRFGRVIANCTTRIGAESDPVEIAKMVPQLTVTDRTVLLFLIRRATLGNSYPFEAECSNPNCVDEKTARRTRGIYVINLAELTVTPPVNPLERSREVQLSRRKVVVRPMTGDSEARIARFDVDQSSLAILGLLHSLDGVKVEIRPTARVGDIADILKVVKSLTLGDRNLIREAAKEMGGEVDTSVEATCQSCGRELKLDMDLQQSFFFPSATRKP